MPLDRYKAAGDQLELGWAEAGAGDLIRRAGGDTTVYSQQLFRVSPTRQQGARGIVSSSFESYFVKQGHLL